MTTERKSFADFQKIFDSRAKGKDFKILYRHLIMTKDGDSSFLLRKRNRAWVDINAGSPNGRLVYERKELEPTDFMRVTNTPEGAVAELLVNIGGSDNTEKHLIEQLVPGVRVYSDASNYRNYKHKVRLRFLQADVTHPVAVGLKINLDTRELVSAPEDTKLVVDRVASKPINEFISKVLKVMLATYKLGGYEGIEAHWENRYAIKDVNPHDLSDENITNAADAAYKMALRATSAPVEYDWEHDKVTRQMVKVPRDAMGEKERYLKRLRNNAREYLASYLRKHNGGYKEVKA